MRSPVVTSTAERITDAGVVGSNVKPVPAGTPLMSFKLTIGRVAMAGCNLFTNEAIAAFHVDAASVSPGWLLYALPRSAARVVTDTAVKGATLNKRTLRELPLELPPLPEQRRIAEILNTLDEAILMTEQVIAKLQKMRQGLLHDLLTRGIDEHGELRDPKRHPEKFKDSPLGWIPKGWDVLGLEDCLLRAPQNGLYKPATAIGSGALMVGQTAFTSSRSIDYSLARRAITTADEIARWGLAEGDVLVSRVFATVEGVGQPVLVPELSEPAVYESNMMRLRVNEGVVAPAFLLHSLQHPLVRRQVVTNVNLSNQASINQRGLKQVRIAVPNCGEQQEILAAIRSVQQDETTETETSAKLRSLKHGLMEDLLTGRVRVTVSEEATP